MAEFQEVMQQKKRMCNSVLCCKCDIYRLCGEDLSKCPQFISNNPKKAEEVIMSWAAENPEPVYPTWEQYLADLMTADMKADKTDNPNSVENYMRKTQIPADIAKKLGIEPKEDKP